MFHSGQIHLLPVVKLQLLNPNNSMSLPLFLFTEGTQTTVEKGKLDFSIKIFFGDFFYFLFFKKVSLNLIFVMNYILAWIGVNKGRIGHLPRIGFKLFLREKRELPVFESNQTTGRSIHVMTAMENGVVS